MNWIDRLESKIDRSAGPDACHPWVSPRRGPDGRGRFTIGRQEILAPRAVWLSIHGEIPEGMRVLHRCDVPACCNSAHLFLGTLKDNSQDMASRGRQRYQGRSHCQRGHPVPPSGGRCAECIRDLDRARWHRRNYVRSR